MFRFAVIAILIAGLLATGCSKNDDDVAALEQEASQDEAAAVLDSLQQEGVIGDSAAITGEVSAAVKPEPETETYQPKEDYSGYEGFVVQTGSYSSYEFAEMMAEKYRNRDYPAFVTTVDIEGVTYYRLRIGVYETQEEAKQIGELLVDRYSAEYWVDSNR